MTAVEFIECLRTENQAFYSDDRGRGALKDLQVVFPLPWIYLAELVQNAIDAKATRIRFGGGPEGTLVLEHNGNPFTQEDVRALCTRGVSTKSTNTVGFMGVGFKSVFKAYERVVVSSGGWKFKLSVPSDVMFGVRQWIGAVLPRWAPDAERPGNGFTCRFELSGRVAEGTCNGDLAELLRGSEPLLPLLAWNRISKFEVGEQSWTFLPTEVAINGGDTSRVKVAAASPDGTARTWLLLVKSYQPSAAAVIRFLQHRQIQPTPEEREEVLAKASRLREVILFCELGEDGSPLPVNRGQCFSLVPTGHTTCLGLHMQAEWLLDISRREPMRISGDPWQQEILAQVPYLLKAYLEWMVSDETNDAKSWANGYNALPGPAEDNEVDAATRAGAVADELRALLSTCRFLPFKVPENKVEFTTPAEARVLPEPLQRATSGPASLQADLFGSRILAPGTLDTRATTFLREVGLLNGLTAQELESEWAAGKVADWHRNGGEGRDAAYVRVVSALAELDSDPAWKGAKLRCLPAADGEWRPRQDLKRYPANWAILNPSPAVTAALETFVGARAQLLQWDIDQLLRREYSAARYLEPLGGVTLEQVAAAWWASLPLELPTSDRDLVVAFTDLVRRQKTLPRLVPKLLAVEDGAERLLPIEQVVLADPYAGSYRRRLFPAGPAVSGVYLTCARDATDADWRVFFEGQDPGPKGRPVLLPVKSSATQEDLSLVRYGARRVTYRKTEWQGIEIDTNHYYLVDIQWPTGAPRVGTQPTDASADAVQRWILEQPALFKAWVKPSIVYIPYGNNAATSATVPRDAEWLAELKAAAWLFDHSGKGPSRPDDILAGFDPSRPDTPVARLADGFAALAAELGIDFGRAIPHAPAMDRLRVLGPAASWEALRDLLGDAIGEAGDDDVKISLLRSILNQAPLFALPAGRQTPDGAMRVPASRLVLKGRRSTLGDWVCNCEEFPDDGPERAVLEQVVSIAPLPEGTTSEQAAAFLMWIWKSEPDADRVRQILPRAYQYALEAEELASSLRPAAKVFVTSRHWAQVNDDVFLNDLGIPDKDLLAADVGIQLATPGHLGDDDESRRRTCGLIGLDLASDRYRLETHREIGGVLTPETWQSGFERAQNRFWEQVQGIDDNDEGNRLPEVLQLVCVDTITRRLLKDDEEIEAFDSTVAIDAAQACVVGEPLDFAPDLAEALIEHWGITLRRDGYSLGSRLTGLLARIDKMPVDIEPPEPPPPPEPAKPGAEDVVQSPTAATEGTKVGGDGQRPEDPNQNGQKAAPPKHTDPSHTRRQKDAKHDWLQRKRKDLRLELKNIERQIAEGLSAEVEPEGEDDRADDQQRRPFGDDEEYREAAVDYEKRHGRFPEVADKTQAGYDINSYSHDKDHPDRVLVRRIEVKGKGGVWKDDEIVEMSDRQMKDALARRVQEGERTAADFDYWLYVVETSGTAHTVIPLRNPVRRAARFEFRGGLWRAEEEVEAPPPEPTTDDCPSDEHK